jgi:hypothetical protein
VVDIRCTYITSIHYVSDSVNDSFILKYRHVPDTQMENSSLQMTEKGTIYLNYLHEPSLRLNHPILVNNESLLEVLYIVELVRGMGRGDEPVLEVGRDRVQSPFNAWRSRSVRGRRLGSGIVHKIPKCKTRVAC